MTLQLLHSEFPYTWGKFYFIFYQCTLAWMLWLAATSTTLLRAGWETPRLTSRPWFMSIISCTLLQISWFPFKQMSYLKEQCHEIFAADFFPWTIFLEAPENNIRVVSSFFSEICGDICKSKCKSTTRRWAANISLREFSKKFETALMVYTGLGGNWFMKKTLSRKSRGTVPLNSFLLWWVYMRPVRVILCTVLYCVQLCKLRLSPIRSFVSNYECRIGPWTQCPNL